MKPKTPKQEAVEIVQDAKNLADGARIELTREQVLAINGLVPADWKVILPWVTLAATLIGATLTATGVIPPSVLDAVLAALAATQGGQ